MPTIPGYYTIAEAAEVLNRSESQVSRYIKNGQLTAVHLGNQYLIEQVAVHQFTPRPRGNPNFRKSQTVT